MLVQSKTLKKVRIWLGFINCKDCGDLCVYWSTTWKFGRNLQAIIVGRGWSFTDFFLSWMIFRRLKRSKLHFIGAMTKNLELVFVSHQDKR